jgi:hypothetical protein
MQGPGSFSNILEKMRHVAGGSLSKKIHPGLIDNSDFERVWENKKNRIHRTVGDGLIRGLFLDSENYLI